MNVQKIPKGPPFTFLALCDLPETSKKSFPNFFHHSGTVEENTLTLCSPFAIFEPEIWRRLGPVLACFFDNFKLPCHTGQNDGRGRKK